MTGTGFTLVELLVVLALLGLLVGLSAQALPPTAIAQRAAGADNWYVERATALRTGRAVQVFGDHDSTVVLLLPDGRVRFSEGIEQ